MIKDLRRFLNRLNNERVEIQTTDGETFTGISHGYDEAVEEPSWWFIHVRSEQYNITTDGYFETLPFDKFARIRIEGETAWAWDIANYKQDYTLLGLPAV
ncbi:MAG: hypothetical protein FWG68_04690 [Defluviitaleaceae bacterium]|nr:hypothetical protein [Defluviitaleaceae bacterium]